MADELLRIRRIAEEHTGRHDRRELAAAARRLSERYRTAGHAGVPTPLEADAYAVTRLPATFAAADWALGALAERLLSFEPTSQLDLGTGCGALLLAARHRWPGLAAQVGVDRSAAMLAVAAALAGPATDRLRLVEGPVETALREVGPADADLVTAGYLLGELAPRERNEVIDAIASRAGGVVVIVEPGTPEGFRTVLVARDRLVAGGARVLAPCPHGRACPLAEPEWCHFAVRLDRSPLHRSLKGGSAPFEDEKFSYVAALLGPAAGVLDPGDGPARVVRRPARRRGFVELSLCGSHGLERVRVSRRDPGYPAASRRRWGDLAAG